MGPPDVPTVVGLASIGLAAGFLAGLLGVGGGVVLVPGMVLLLGFDQHVAQGTSLLVVIPAALSGSWSHRRSGRLVLRDAFLLAVGGIAGAVGGSLFALSLDDGLLRRLFGLFLLAIALRILVAKGARRGPGTPQPGPSG
ncbi:MAG TPA: TSUP family transporter [Candidatus Limnocylindria bacterium]|nr:TSUP family transporter [Candidatus Limnocylindria bacterium]